MAEQITLLSESILTTSKRSQALFPNLENIATDLKTIRSFVLNPSGVTAGTYGTSSKVAQITVDNLGRVTSASEVSIVVAPGAISLPDGQILVGNAANVGVAVTMSGDVTITNTGVSSIGANKVIVTTMLSQINTSTVLGRSAAGVGNVQVLTTLPKDVQDNITRLGTIVSGVWNGTTIAIANGGTGQITANAAFNALAPSQGGNAGKFLTTNGTDTSWASAVTAPAGANTQVQFNNAGAFGASANFTWNTGTNALTVTGTATVTTSITSPVVIGGTGVGSTLILRSTSGVGSTSAIIMQVGNNGATESARILNGGQFLIGATTVVDSSSRLEVTGANFPVCQIIRTTATTNSDVGGFNLLGKTSGNMVDGFGSSFTIQVQDNTSSREYMAAFTGFRDGADNSGGAKIITYNAGSPNLNAFVIKSNGNIGIGLTPASITACLHLKAGTAAASTSPLKFTSGTNLTTAEAGSMEYNGTNLFFTRAGTVRENVLVAIDNVAAPGTNLVGVIVNRYGGATNFLGDPDRWISVNILGTTYKIALYNV